MIKIFRKQTSHLKTNWFNYGLDTLVVIVGILIALALNNWNDERKSKAKEITLLKEMTRNLEEDHADVIWNINNSKKRLKANETILYVLENNLPFHDSLRYYYGNILGNTQLTENTSAYDNLMSIGFDLIKNDSLRGKITRLYSNRYEYITNVEQRLDDKFQYDQLFPQLIQYIVIDKMWKSAYPIDQNKLQTEHAFRETIKFNIFIRKIMIREYKTLETEISDLIFNIEKEIE